MHHRFRELYIAFAIVAVAVPIQYWLWTGPFPYTDSGMWVKAAQDFAQGSWPTFSSTIPAHPGTSILLPVSALIAIGIYPIKAMALVMSVLMALSIALMAYLCRLLRPASLWWLCVAAFFIPNPLYMQMSVPSALAGTLTCIYVLLLLYIREHGVSRDSSFYLGMSAGILLATRIDAGASVILFSLIYLLPLVGRQIFRVALVAMLFFAALDPYLWLDALQHIWSILSLVGSNTQTSVDFDYYLWAFYYAFAAFGLGTVAAYHRSRFSSLPIDFLKWILAFSALLSCLFLLSKSHPIRYFFPIMAIWEMLLPLFALEIMRRFRSSHLLQPLWRSEYALVALLATGRLITIYTLWVHALGPILYRVV